MKKKCIKLRRSFLTLMELMIVITILSLMTGILAVNISNLVIDQRFRNEVSRVVDQLRLAQDLMLILGTDVHLYFSEDPNGDGIKYWIELETQLPEKWQKEILRRHPNLRTVRGVFIEDKTVEGSKPEQGKIDLKFLSGGSVMSKGLLRLSTSDNERSPPEGTLDRFICLQGYPHPIYSVATRELANCETKDQEEADKRLTQDTVSRLPDKIKDLKSISQEQKKEEAQQNQETPIDRPKQNEGANEVNSRLPQGGGRGQSVLPPK